MPVHCPVKIAPLSTEELGKLDYKVMRHAFDCQNALGRLAEERIYQADLAARLTASGFSVSRELELVLSYESFQKSLYLDLVVEDQGVYEIKVAKAISDAHIGQLLTYLHLLDLPRGKLLNFGSAKVEGKYVNAPLRTAQRRAFQFFDSDYNGPGRFRQHVFGLLRDWGTSLTLSLYQEALVALLGGYENVEARMPMNRESIHLGNQKFLLVDEESAFQLTALNQDTETFCEQLQRLICFSPLKAIHWVNIQYESVTLRTLVRR